MSMNLHCEEINLWQTPTYITYMCFSKGDGGWKGIKYRYSQWVESLVLNKVWNNEEELNDMKKAVDEHLSELNKYKKLTFSIM